MLSIATLLLLIMDPFGNMMIVNSLLGKQGLRDRAFIVVREGLIAAALLVMASFGGQVILDHLGLEEYSMRLAGGIVLFLIALGMVFPSRKIIEETEEETPLVVPIAVPLIAGPSAISMAILFAEKNDPLLVAQAVIIATAITTLILVLSPILLVLLRKRGAIALERLMGILLTILSVQMILDGVNVFLDSRAIAPD